MKRVLVISYYWPPSGGSGVQRWVKFSKYLPSQGWQPVVYTPENPELTARDESLAADVSPETEIVRRPILEPYGIWHAIRGARKGGESGKEGAKTEVNPINAGKKSFGQRVAMWIRGNLFIPDPRCLWVNPSVRFLKKYLKEHPVDIIVSTGPPHSMHLIARKLSHATGLPWVADFRDPWTRMFYFKHLHLGKFALKKHIKLEKDVLDGATRVIAVSPLVKKEFEQMTSTPVELITNGFDESDIECAPKDDNGFFNITHTGLFASDGNPDVLWKVLSDLCASDAAFSRKLRIRLVGKTDRDIIDSIRDAGLGECLTDLGYRPHAEAVKEQKNASLLILPLRKEPEYKATLPGKLFEYLASGRPILGIGQKDGAMAAIVADTATGEMTDWDEYDRMKAYVLLVWNAFREGRNPISPKNIERYSRKELTVRLATLLDSLTSE
ncbi:MAG: glycosyltransferase [Candidatus Cryptobacteroides sp.]